MATEGFMAHPDNTWGKPKVTEDMKEGAFYAGRIYTIDEVMYRNIFILQSRNLEHHVRQEYVSEEMAWVPRVVILE